MPFLVPGDRQQFHLEEHLHVFLRDNWDHTDLGKDWAIHSEPGEPDAGYKYQCGVGEMDFLAYHRTKNKWLVIELKRYMSTDKAVGQVLRYMGWVQNEMLQANEVVEGLIISKSGDDKIVYAVSAVPNLAFMEYEIEFQLTPTKLAKL